MAFNRDSARQYPLVASVDLTYSDVTSSSAGVIQLPPNATVIGGELVVDVAWNDTGATATINVGDSGSATRYVSGADLKSTGRTALTLTGYKTTTSSDVNVVLASGNGDASAGSARLNVMYIIEGRANEVGEPST